jgi:hypothetical protein
MGGMRSTIENLRRDFGGAGANVLASATEEDVAAIHPAQTYERLAAVEHRYDPADLFARDHDVRPQPSVHA